MSEEMALSGTARPTGLQQFAGFDVATYKALRESIGGDAPEPDFKAHLLICQRLGLHPVGGHVHLVPRETKVDGKKVIRYSTQIGIDGYRSLAEDTGLYEGPCGLPLFQYEFGEPWTDEVDVSRVPYAAKVGIYRQGRREPIWAVAPYVHYAALRWDYDKKEYTPMAMWAKMPHVMLAKCAEALALRKAFPRQLGGIYSQEEMSRHATAEVVVERESPPDALPPRPERPQAEVFDPRQRPQTSQVATEPEAEEVGEGEGSEPVAEVPLPSQEQVPS